MNNKVRYIRVGKQKKMKNDIKNNIPVIGDDTNYWIIRSGVENAFYEEFFYNSCIALGWDRINDIESIENIDNIQQLKNTVKVKYPELEQNRSKSSYTRKISDISTKIFKFINELKIGDIIVTPGSNEVLIGEIISDPYLIDGYYENVAGTELMGSLNKARKVKWLKRIRREDLEPNFRLILGVYHGIAHIKSSQVITEINRTLYNFYIEYDKGHSIFRITEEAEVDFQKYAYFIKSTNEIYSKLKHKYKKEKLTIKTNVQSPGPIELIGDFGLVSSLVLGLKAFLKHDENALNSMDEDAKKAVQAYIESKEPEYEYDDYEFPNHGSY